MIERYTVQWREEEVVRDKDGRFCYYVDVEEIERQLTEVTAERDQLRAQLKLADALINRERNLNPLLKRQAG
jgi:hypothetical protein